MFREQALQLIVWKPGSWTYITEPLACLDLRLDATFKQEYSDASHAITLALFTSMKAQVSKPLYVAQLI